MTSRTRTLWTFAITSAALFMVVLDNLVVTTALPTIQRSLGASIQELEWTVNAYTLTFAVLLLTGAALGDRFGRRRMFVIGLAVFTASSAAAALAPDVNWLIAARAAQGFGGAMVLPLTLTLLSDAVPVERRGLALGFWSAISGLGVAIGPLVGGAVVEGISWQWIFWLNVPIGLAVLPFAATRLRESHGPDRSLDIPGLALVSGGLFGIVWGLVRGNSLGWTDPQILAALGAGAVLVASFVAWELRTSAPMLPMRFFRSRAFAASNAASLLMYFGMFGSIFLLTQYLQLVHGYSPLRAGVATLPWTAMPMLIAPIAGAYVDRIGGRPLMATGMALQAGALAWLAMITSTSTPYLEMVIPFMMAGVGMALYFAPSAHVVLGSVSRRDEGKASGAANAIRELGGVFGVAVLGTIFSTRGGYGAPQHFVDGLVPAVAVGAAVVAVGAGIALAIPRRRRAADQAAQSRSKAPSARPNTTWPATSCTSTRRSPNSSGQLPSRTSGCSASNTSSDGHRHAFSIWAAATAWRMPRPPRRSNTTPNTAPFSTCTPTPTGSQYRSGASIRPTSRGSLWGECVNRRRPGSTAAQMPAAAAPAAAARSVRPIPASYGDTLAFVA
jgi:EmrB/QacA subfamily drug resistance transporter